MAAVIDVFFTGLMLICLDGQPNCPKGPFAVSQGKNLNTSWVVKADGESMPCGRDSPEKTQLEIAFLTNDFDYDPGNVIACTVGSGRVICVLLPDDVLDREICVTPSSGTLDRNELLDKGLSGLPHLDEMDQRFKTLRTEQLKAPYVPTRIYFPDGVVNTGDKWPSAVPEQPTLWYRSNGSSGGDLPRGMSDRLKVTYQAKTPFKVSVTICGSSQKLIELTLKAKVKTAEVVLRNAARDLNPDHVGQFDDLGYLLWYYPLGSWDTPFGGACPDYSSKDPVLLRCIRDSRDGCAFRRSQQSDTKFWPPVVRP
jgi:hypothetical protein